MKLGISKRHYVNHYRQQKLWQSSKFCHKHIFDIQKNGTWHTPKYFSKYFRLTEFHEFGWWWDWFRFTYFHSISQIMFDAAHPLVLQTANYDFFFWQFSCQNKFFSPSLVNFMKNLIIYHNLQFQELVDIIPHIDVSKILYEI